MARIFMEGWEHEHIGTSEVNATHTGNKQTGLMTNYTSTPDFGSRFKFSLSPVSYGQGKRSFRFEYSGHSNDSYNMSIYTDLGSDKEELYTRLNFRPEQIRPGEVADFFAIYETHDRGNEFIRLRTDDSSTIKVFFASEQIGTFSVGNIINNWSIIEVHAKRGSGDGLVEIKVNQELVFAVYGLTNTRYMRSIHIGQNNSRDNRYPHSDTVMFFDDLAVNDTQGTNNNSWVGEGSICMLRPAQDGTFTDFDRIPIEKDTHEILANRPFSENEYIRSEGGVGNKASVKIEEVKNVLDQNFDYDITALGIYVTARRSDGTAYIKLSKDSEESDAILLNTDLENAAEQAIFQKSSGTFTEAEVEDGEYTVENAGQPE